MKVTDNRAAEAETVVVSDDPVALPEGLSQLTPEELAAKTAAIPEEVSEEQAQAMIKEAYEKAEAKEKELTAALSGIGTYILVRFENPTSVRNVVKFSEPRPQDRAVIAVLGRIVREMEAYEIRNWWAGADELDAETKKQSEDEFLRQEAIKRGLPVNRKTLRMLRKDLKDAED